LRFFLVSPVSARAREETLKTRMDKGYQGDFKLSQFCLFPGLFCHFPGLSVIFRVLSTYLPYFFLTDIVKSVTIYSDRYARKVTELGTTEITKEKKVQHYDVSADRSDGERWVYMSNAVARAAQGLSLAEKRIVGIAAARLDSRRAPPPGGAPVTRITAMVYAETFGIDLNTAYEQLQDAGKNLYKRSITFTEPKRGRKGGAVHTLRWIGRATYHDGEGWLELAWWHEVMPHLCGLKDQFTKYQLQQASALRSLYSWRLLEMIQSWQNKGRFEINIDDFATAMEASEKQRQDFAAIRRRMIEPAIKELIEKDGWLIQWEPVKTGRKVGSLRFTFMKNPQGSLL